MTVPYGSLWFCLRKNLRPWRNLAGVALAPLKARFDPAIRRGDAGDPGDPSLMRGDFMVAYIYGMWSFPLTSILIFSEG